MTTWGGWNNHMRVGLDIYTSSITHSTTSCTLYVKVTVQCDSSWSFNDSETVTLYDNGNSTASWSFQNTLGANQTLVVGTKTWTENLSYSGGPSWTFKADLTGNYLGGTSTVSQDYTLPARPITVPSAPGAPSFSSIAAQGATVSFTGASDNGGSSVNDTHLEIATDSAFSHVVWDDGKVSTSYSFGVSGLIPNTKYYARAQTHNAAGWSGWSSTTSFTTDDFTCARPSLSSVTANSVKVSWASPGNGTPTGAQLQIATDSGFTKVVQTGTYSSWLTAAVVSGLTPGATYYFRVRANTSTGYGGWSSAASTSTDDFTCARPTLTNVAATSLTMNWASPGNGTPTSYQIQYADNSSFSGATTDSTIGTPTSKNITGLVPGTTYYFRVRANTSNGYGGWSAATSSKTLSGAKVRVSGAWVDGIAYVRVSGAWKQALVYKRLNGSWTQ